ncbi:MAG: SLC13 family permease [Pseudomonadales bacterium]
MTAEILTVFLLVALALVLFIREWLPIDLSAMLVLAFLGVLDAATPLDLLPENQLFSGFSSRAVIAIIGVTIVAKGLEKTGLMVVVARWISSRSRGETSTKALIMSSAGLVSAFVQNIGVAAMFVPITRRVAKNKHLNVSNLMMPMAFCVILGGTITMVGSAPLILVNDLLPPGYPPFGLFDVAPIGLLLLLSGILLFVFFGRVLGLAKPNTDVGLDSGRGFTYDIDETVRYVVLDETSGVRQMTVGELEKLYQVKLVSVDTNIGDVTADTSMQNIAEFALYGVAQGVDRLLGLSGVGETETPAKSVIVNPDFQGLVEIVVRPGSSIINHNDNEMGIFRDSGLSPVALLRDKKVYRSNLDLMRLNPGDAILCYGAWDHVVRLESGEDFVIPTQDYPRITPDTKKIPTAIALFALALGAILWVDIPLSLVFFSCAVAMMLLKIISVSDAYKSVSWKTVFLLASLIPLGSAMQFTGAAQWLAQYLIELMGSGSSELAWLALAAVLSTALTLVMSNVGATVILIPLFSQIAIGLNLDPGKFALLVAICVSNSFLIPTHQVNALIMNPGKYRSYDFLRAGAVMTVLCIMVSLVGIELFF